MERTTVHYANKSKVRKENKKEERRQPMYNRGELKHEKKRKNDYDRITEVIG
jgi:hypothetical protein